MHPGRMPGNTLIRDLAIQGLEPSKVPALDGPMVM